MSDEADYIEKINVCPVCGKPDGTYREYKDMIYICGRYQEECKVCKEEGWSFSHGTGGGSHLSYKDREVNMDNKKVRRPYKNSVTEDCFINRK